MINFKINNSFLKLSFLLIIFCVLRFKTFAGPQTSKLKILNKIIARIDDEIVTKSDLDSAYIQYKAQFGNTKEQGIKYELLSNLIISKLFLSKRKVDIEVDDQMIRLMLNDRINQMLSRVGGTNKKKKLENSVGMPMRELKRILKKNITDQYIISTIQDNIAKDITVNLEEVSSYIKKHKKEIPIYEKSIVLKTLINYPRVTDKEKKSILNKLKDIKILFESGAKFKDLVQEYSEDESSISNSGSIGFFWKEGDLLKEYEEAVFKLNKKKDINAISEPTETKNGFYLIQIEQKKGNEFLTRHILIKPKNIGSQIKEAFSNLQNIKNDIISKKTTFDNEIKKLKIGSLNLSDTGYIKNKSGGIRLTKKELPKYIKKDIFTQKKGSIVGPAISTINKNTKVLQLILVEDVIPKHIANIEYDYEDLRDIVKEEKRRQKMKEWIQKAKIDADIIIDKEYRKFVKLDL